ncbi:hypothetical protein PsorP6_011257 [Peronosclerospora sorghi]|uniref:Uncharacterized protein n=1 Tax=Peronosclerospora sorghi TaxID=230839 RepID=A0ACC0WJX3_9STRA|nr:hypothetical protein PsorP6_011257 [Peronosclerospora sorghi]
MLDSVNSFEWLSEVMGDTTPPDHDIILCILNYQYLRNLVFGHAVLRVTSTRTSPAEEDGALSNRLSILFPSLQKFDDQSILSELFPDQDLVWLQVHLAELDLALQIIAPSIYMDLLKLRSIIGNAASALPHPLWLLWDEYTLETVIMSPLIERILNGPLPAALREIIITSEDGQNMTSYTRQYGVGLLLTPSVPLHNLRDVTKKSVSTSGILEHYLVVHGKLDSVDTYIHVVYAPAQPSQRKHFFL